MPEEEKTKEGETVVRECRAVAEEETWSVWNQVKEQVLQINQGVGRRRVGGRR